jgi:hypothetical protein
MSSSPNLTQSGLVVAESLNFGIMTLDAVNPELKFHKY